MATTLTETTKEFSAPRRSRAWGERFPIASALLFITFIVLVGWFTYASARAENEVRRSHRTMESR